MDTLLVDLIEKITLYNLITVTFVCAFLISLLRLIAPGGIQYQKICMALAIFLIALIENNTLFYIASVVIGGTLVAGKEFMLMLTCIWKAREEDMIKAILAYIQTVGGVSAPAEKDEQNISEKTTTPSDELNDIPIIKK